MVGGCSGFSELVGSVDGPKLSERVDEQPRQSNMSGGVGWRSKSSETREGERIVSCKGAVKGGQ